MIDERREEQACLHVLGALTPEETRAFEAALAQDAELRRLVAALRLSRDALAGSLPQATPPPALRQRILESVPPPEPAAAPSARSKRRFEIGWRIGLSWALAAGLAVVCAISLAHQKSLRQKVGEQAEQLAGLNRLADALRGEAQDLKQTVATLEETNQFQNVRIAMLNSMLADSPKAAAVSLWDQKLQRGVFVVQNLKPLPADKDYQLWVIDPKYPTPVSAGVFQVDAQGNVRLPFTADKPIESAAKFAVTEEPKGGSSVPTLKNLALIGG